MEDILKQVYSAIKQNEVRAFNHSKTKDEAVCINLIEIPDTEHVVVTVTVLKDRKKKASLDYKSFAKLMTEIDRIFSHIREYESEDDGTVYFKSLHSFVTNSWYNLLGCHRLFLIPKNYIFYVLDLLTEDKLAQTLRSFCGIKELNFYVNTSSHNLKIVRFVKEEQSCK